MDDQTSAIDHLRTIRALMEKANAYRAVNVPTALFGGAVSLLTAWILYSLDRKGTFVEPKQMAAAWSGVLALVAVFNTALIWRTAKKDAEPFWSPSFKMALKAIAPALFVGGILAAALALREDANVAQASACCATFYGLALMATSGFSPRSLRVLGLAFTIVGTVFWGQFLRAGDLAYLSHERWSAIIMGSTFGIFHLIYGIVVGLLQRR